MKAAFRSWLGLTGLAALTVSAALGPRGAAAQERDPLPVPDLPGMKTLKADFHLHTVFSDGEVWPTVHVRDAWRDGLDVVALTDHVEYHPHASDVSVDLLRPYALARPLADELGIILIPGVEITRPAPGSPATIPVGSGHFNALFVTDPKALEVPGLQDALRRAHAQGAFVFWNHPGFMGTLEPRWHPHVEEAYREGLFQGVELVNGKDFYPAVYPWIVEKGLAIISNSDIHLPTPPRAVGGPRPITLVFARTADAEGVREALWARRTAAWLGDDVWGAEEHLRGLWQGALSPFPSALSARPGQRLVVRVQNASAIPFRLRPGPGPAWVRLEAVTVQARATSLVYLPIARDAPAGRQRVALEVEVTNLHIGPGHELVVTVPLEITVAPPDRPFDLQGHRGARGLAPENTLAAFARALSLGVTTLELDTAVTRDGIVVVSHDSTLNPDLSRRPGGTWLEAPAPAIFSLTRAELLRYDVGRLRPGTPYARNFPEQVPLDGTRIPTLHEVYALAKKAGNASVRFNVETKLDPRKPDETPLPDAFADAVLAVVRDAGALDRTSIQSFDWRTLRRVQRVAPAVETCYLSVQAGDDQIQAGRPQASPWLAGLDVDDFGGSVPRLVRAAGGRCWSPNFRDLRADTLAEAHRLGLRVVPWTVNRPEDMAAVIALGVDGLISDRPDLALRAMQEKGLALPKPTPIEP